MLLEILRPLEGLAAEIAFVRFQRYVHAYVRCDVVAFDGRGATCTPLAGEIEVVSTLSAHVPFAYMVVECFC